VATVSDSGAVSRDVEQLEQELVDLRTSVEKDTSSFAELERQVGDLKDRLDRTVESVRSVEARLEAKRIELVEARRAEAVAAYKDHLSARDERALGVAHRTDELLAELDAYDRDTAATREILAEMRNHRGYELQAAEVEAELADDPEPYREAWERLAEVVKARSGKPMEEQLIDAAERSPIPRAIENLPEHLQDEAHARRRARIKEHFNNR
jgi:chromosome segregation ATPase